MIETADDPTADPQLDVYPQYPFDIERGQDVWVYTSQGRRYLDLYGGHAVALLGHCHPRVVEAVRKQVGELIFYSNLAPNRSRTRAARALVDISPAGLERVFFVNSGGEANDNAIKLARMVTGRKKVISLEGSFHGRTVAAISATGIEKFRRIDPLLPYHDFVPLDDLEAASRMIDGDTAAVLVEPIQSMNGVRMASSQFYSGLRGLCDRSGALLIYDEIQTGLGRTGDYFFASRGPVPDMMTVAKGLASGVPAAALLVSSEIGRAVKKGDLGSTFGGAPLACAAIEATLEVVSGDGFLQQVRDGSRDLRERCASAPGVEEVLGLGYLIGLRFSEPARLPYRRLQKAGILTGLSGDPHVLRLLPPLTLGRAEIDLFVEALGAG